MANIFIPENACENVVWKMAAILSQPQYVKTLEPIKICRRHLKIKTFLHEKFNFHISPELVPNVQLSQSHQWLN